MSQAMLSDLLRSLWQTTYMVGVSSFIAALLGTPLGVLLITTRKGAILSNPAINSLTAAIVNGLRSIPFIILLVAIIPFTRLIAGTSIGTTAAIVPLTVGTIPFIARIVENTLEEVPSGLIEAGLAMGATPLQIITKILIPEGLVGIINGLTVTVITLINYSAMAGAVGAGGLGDLAIRYGYQRFNLTVMLVTIIILILLVQMIQMIGDWVAKACSH
jgi:D-methionine transport system permease protein